MIHFTTEQGQRPFQYVDFKISEHELPAPLGQVFLSNFSANIIQWSILTIPSLVQVSQRQGASVPSPFHRQMSSAPISIPSL